MKACLSSGKTFIEVFCKDFTAIDSRIPSIILVLSLDRHIVYVIVSHAKYQICRGIDKIFSCIIHDDNDRPRFEIKIHMNDDAQLINARLCLKTTGLVNLRENKILVYV